MSKKQHQMKNSDKTFSGYIPADIDEYALGGGIPERYKNMGFSRVGQKKESTRAGKKWMVLAKKGDKYKVVHGGYTGMKDFSQHGSEKRKDRFWDRMGGKNSAKAKDPFSPLYWHKRLGTWQQGGEWFNEDSQDFFQVGGQTLYAYVKSMGLDPSFASRKKLLSQFVEGEYKGTAEQNIDLLRRLQSGEISLDSAKSSTTKEPKKSSAVLPKNGFIVDRGTNIAYVFNDQGAEYFPVLTGRSTDPTTINSTAGLEERRNNPSAAVTPTGYFLMNQPITGRMAAPYQGNAVAINGIDAYGIPGVNTHNNGSVTAVHQTYNPGVREPLYDQDAEARRASAGCVNCTAGDYQRMRQMTDPTDTMFVFDSRRPEESHLLSEVQEKYRQANVPRMYTDALNTASSQDATYMRPMIVPQQFREKGGWIQAARESMEKKGTVGAFTNQARREGYEDTQEFANYVINNPEQFSATTKKRAQFAKNMGKLHKAVYGKELPEYQTRGQVGSGIFNEWMMEQQNNEFPQYPLPTASQKNRTKRTPKFDFSRWNPSESSTPPIDFMQFDPNKDMPFLDFKSQYETTEENMRDPFGAFRKNVEATLYNNEKTKDEPWWADVYGYDAFGTKKDPYKPSLLGVAPVAAAPGLVAQFLNRADENRKRAQQERLFMSDYMNPVIDQGAATSHGEYTINEGILDPLSYTPTQFMNYGMEKGGQIATVDEELLEELRAAGAIFEELD